MTRTSFAAALFFVSTMAHAGPLGIDLGKPLPKAIAATLKQVSPYVFSTAKLPKGHQDFDDYRFMITPKHGVCRVTAYISNVRTDTFGRGLRSRFDYFKAALVSKYGEPSNTFDFLREGSIWSEPRDFMTGLVKKERLLESYWQSEKLPLPEGIGTVELKTIGIDAGSAMLAIDYEAVNADECQDWIAAQKNANL